MRKKPKARRGVSRRSPSQTFQHDCVDGSVAEAEEFVTRVLRNEDDLERYAHGSGWIYRGQRVACWRPRTSLDRCFDLHQVAPEHRAMLEWALVREFKRAYHHYSVHIPHSDAVVEWLAVMQHHGGPTRLLDFTYSPYIAAYFAVDAAEGASAVWAVNTRWALAQSKAGLRAVGKRKRDVDTLEESFVEHSERIVAPLFLEPRYARVVCPLNPFRLNERLRIQKGVFLAQGTVDASFLENLRAMPGHRNPGNVVRMVIPAELAERMRKRLFEMNISRRSLFPGLDGYAGSLGVYLPSFDKEDPHFERLLAAWGQRGGWRKMSPKRGDDRPTRRQ